MQASFLDSSFTQKLPESSDSVCSSIFLHEIIILPEADWIRKKLWILFLFSLSPRGLIIRTKITISCEFSPLQVQLWYHTLSCIKTEEHMESELCSIFWIKLVAKNMLLGSLGTQRWAVSAVWCLSLEKCTNVLN